MADTLGNYIPENIGDRNPTDSPDAPFEAGAPVDEHGPERSAVAPGGLISLMSGSSAAILAMVDEEGHLIQISTERDWLRELKAIWTAELK